MNRATRCGATLFLCALVVIAAAPCEAAPEFHAVPDLPGSGNPYLRVEGLSADGRTVIGDAARDGVGGAFRWTASTGITLIGGPLDGGTFVHGLAVNGDGSSLAGYGDSTDGLQGYRWSQSSGFDLIQGPGGAVPSVPTGMSADGAVVVGRSYPAGGPWSAYRWTKADGMQDLGTLNPGGGAQAYGISADGTKIVGNTPSTDGLLHPFLWTASDGMMDLGLPELFDFAGATAISGDGSVITGWSSIFSSRWAWRWTSITGFELLDPLWLAEPSAINGDGSMIGGTGQGGIPFAFLWTPSLGLVNLNEYLPSIGVDLTGWDLSEVRGISADGLTIVGNGTFDNASRGWILTIPTPTTSALFVLAAAFAGRKRRRLAAGLH